MGTKYEVDNNGVVDFQQSGTLQFVLEQGTGDPSGVIGQIFYRTDTNELRIHNGASFQTISAAAGGWQDTGVVVKLSTNTDQIQIGNGSVGTPALAFENSPTTGYFRKGADNLGISIAGSEVGDWDSGGLNLVDDLQVGGNVIIQDVTNQLVLGVTNTVTLTAPAPSSSRTLTIPDPGADASFVMTELAQTINGVKTFGDQAQFDGGIENLFGYRRPVLKFSGQSAIRVEVNTGIANKTTVTFSDGTQRSVTDAGGLRQFGMTATAEFAAGTLLSGLRSGISETANTWYAMYAVKVTKIGDTDKFVLAGDTTEPLQANVATLNSRYGTDSWEYLGVIRNGDSNTLPNDILQFFQLGNHTIFTNTLISNVVNSHGIQLATVSSGSVTYSHAAGTGDLQIPGNLILVDYLVLGAGTTGQSNTIRDAASGKVYAAGAYAVRTTFSLIATIASEGLATSTASTNNTDIILAGVWDNVLGAGINPLI